MIDAGLIPWLDPGHIIHSAGPYALLVVCAIIFAETGLLIGFLLPGDTLLIITGLLSFHSDMGLPIWITAPAIGVAAFLGGQVGYLIGSRVGPRVFERRESGFFSKKNVERTNAFFTRFGGLAVILARFVPIVRTFAPVAAGVGHMDRRHYALYNAIGAIVWAVALTVGGYLLGYIHPVAEFVRDYIDVILLAAVAIAVVPTGFHYIRASMNARRLREAEAQNESAPDESAQNEGAPSESQDSGTPTGPGSAS